MQLRNNGCYREAPTIYVRIKEGGFLVESNVPRQQRVMITQTLQTDPRELNANCVVLKVLPCAPQDIRGERSKPIWFMVVSPAGPGPPQRHGELGRCQPFVEVVQERPVTTEEILVPRHRYMALEQLHLRHVFGPESRQRDTSQLVIRVFRDCGVQQRAKSYLLRCICQPQCSMRRLTPDMSVFGAIKAQGKEFLYKVVASAGFRDVNRHPAGDHTGGPIDNHGPKYVRYAIVPQEVITLAKTQVEIHHLASDCEAQEALGSKLAGQSIAGRQAAVESCLRIASDDPVPQGG
jgi:hypothetical protein